MSCRYSDILIMILNLHIVISNIHIKKFQWIKC